MRVAEYPDGLAICGEYPDPEVLKLIADTAGPLPLVVADPPYGNIVSASWDRAATDDRQFCEWMLDWTTRSAPLLLPGAAFYVWGGIGRPRFRPFYRYLADVEERTPFELSAHITWKKRRAYGVQNNYLFTREELAYLVLGNAKKPHLFEIPLLAEKRGYAGYNAKYPAKSEYLRRGMVWDDVTEIFRGKVHDTQKPTRLHEIPIEVHTAPGEWVLDPFAGSGTTALAARALGRRFVVVERDPAIFEVLVGRLA